MIREVRSIAQTANNSDTAVESQSKQGTDGERPFSP